jgi:hypothetical protein
MASIMPEQRDSSAPALTTPPRVFCKGCGYALVGLQSNKCPECGRGFDLGNRRTFARRPPRRALWRWGRRVLAVVLLLLLTAGAGVGWLWWGWRAEQPTIARLQTAGGELSIGSIGPERLRWVLGERLGYLMDRVNDARVSSVGAVEAEQLDFGSLVHVQRLIMIDCELSNSSLSSLGRMANLKVLSLMSLRIEKPDLRFIEKLPGLTGLVLRGKWVGDAGFGHLAGLKHLTYLDLGATGMNDADLQYLQGLSSLVELHLYGNPISDAGLEYLKGLKSLRVLWIDDRLHDSPGVAKLKQAIPGLQVY